MNSSHYIPGSLHFGERDFCVVISVLNWSSLKFPWQLLTPSTEMQPILKDVYESLVNRDSVILTLRNMDRGKCPVVLLALSVVLTYFNSSSNSSYHKPIPGYLYIKYYCTSVISVDLLTKGHFKLNKTDKENVLQACLFLVHCVIRRQRCHPFSLLLPFLIKTNMFD